MIFYFSGTGNTRWVAEEISKAIGEELVSIADALNGDCRFTLKEDERIGFCFPTHGWQPPHIVRQFIARLSVDNAQGHFCWALTTCGDSAGEAMTLLNQDLKRLHLEAETLFSVIMPESYVCLPFMYTDSDERVAEKVSNATRQLSHISHIVKDRKRGIVELDKGATPRLYTYVIGAYFNRHMITDKKFTVDADKCLHCGTCAKVCPTGDVRLNDNKLPIWQHDGSCTCCLACYHHCPTHAINYGNITRKRGQYYFK